MDFFPPFFSRVQTISFSVAHNVYRAAISRLCDQSRHHRRKGSFFPSCHREIERDGNNI